MAKPRHVYVPLERLVMYAQIKSPFNTKLGTKKLKAKSQELVTTKPITQKVACVANMAGLADAL